MRWTCMVVLLGLTPIAHAAPIPLQPLTCEDAASRKSAGNEAVTVSFTNDTASRVALTWVDFQGKPKPYGFIPPHGTQTQPTFAGHVWMLVDASGHCTAAFVATGARDAGPHPRPLRTSVQQGITYVVPEGVSEVALRRAQEVVDAMLARLPAVRASMVTTHFKVELIGEAQVLSDLPDYADLRDRKTFDGRTFDRGTRGVGSRQMCSVGEENLLCRAQQPYRQEDVLVHEFSHSIEAHLPAATVEQVEQAFRDAREHALYPAGGYNQQNAKEYFAEGVQAWFGATLRTDVNGGINTREKLEAHDPALAQVLAQLFGDADVPRANGCSY
jgi:hypothetical protein